MQVNFRGGLSLLIWKAKNASKCILKLKCGLNWWILYGMHLTRHHQTSKTYTPFFTRYSLNCCITAASTISLDIPWNVDIMHFFTLIWESNHLFYSGHISIKKFLYSLIGRCLNESFHWRKYFFVNWCHKSLNWARQCSSKVPAKWRNLVCL